MTEAGSCFTGTIDLLRIKYDCDCIAFKIKLLMTENMSANLIAIASLLLANGMQYFYLLLQ